MCDFSGLVVPKSRVNLHIHNTPLEPFPIDGEHLGGNEANAKSLNFFIKRDDLTGFSFSGNKIRKLEYLLGEAKANGCDTIVSYGKKQSNWCRATVTACKALGFDVHLILNCDDDCQNGDASNFCANYLLDVIYGAKVHIIAKELYQVAQLFISLQFFVNWMFILLNTIYSNYFICSYPSNCGYPFPITE